MTQAPTRVAETAVAPQDKAPGAGLTVWRYVVRCLLLLVFALPLLFMS